MADLECYVSVVGRCCMKCEWSLIARNKVSQTVASLSCMFSGEESSCWCVCLKTEKGKVAEK